MKFHGVRKLRTGLLGATALGMVAVLSVSAATVNQLDFTTEGGPTAGSESVTVSVHLSDPEAEIYDVKVRMNVFDVVDYLTVTGLSAVNEESFSRDLLSTLSVTVYEVTEGAAPSVMAEMNLSPALADTSLLFLEATGLDSEGNDVDNCYAGRLFSVDTTAPYVRNISADKIVTNGAYSVSADVDSSSDLYQVKFKVIGAPASVFIAEKGVLDDVNSCFAERMQTEFASTADQASFNAIFHPDEFSAVSTDTMIYVAITAVDVFGNGRTHSEVIPMTDVRPTGIDSINFAATSYSVDGFGIRVEPVLQATLTGGKLITVTQSVGVDYISSSPDVATSVGQGAVIGIIPGRSVLTADYCGLTAETEIVVGDTKSLTALSFAEDSITLDSVGTSAQLQVNATVFNTDTEVSTDIDVTGGGFANDYSSADQSIITVSEEGIVTALKPGTTTVTVANSYFPSASDIISVTVADGPPSIQIFTSSTRVRENSDFVVQARVDDDLGPEGIAEVIFSIDGRPVYTDTEPEFEVLLRAPERRAGTTMFITAKAVDVSGNEAFSEQLMVSMLSADSDEVPADMLRFYTLTEMENFVQNQLMNEFNAVKMPDVDTFNLGTSIVAGSVLRLAAVAEMPFDKVELVANGKVVAEDRSSRPVVFPPVSGVGGTAVTAEDYCYEFVYPVPTVEAGRSAVFVLKGYKEGKIYTSEFNSLRILEDQLPLPSIVSHVDGQGIRDGATHSIDVKMTDDLDAYGYHIDFFVNDELIEDRDAFTPDKRFASAQEAMGDSTFSFDLEIPSDALGNQYRIRAEVTDFGGHTISTDEVTLFIQPNAPPQLEIVSPLAGSQWVAGDQLVMRASASDDGQISSVVWYINNEKVGVSQRPSEPYDPYEFKVDIPLDTELEDVVVKAVAVDSEGLSMEKQVTVGVVADEIPPAVAISAPKAGTPVLDDKNLLITVGGFDNLGVEKVEFYKNGEAVSFAEVDEVGLKKIGENGFMASVSLDDSELDAGADTKLTLQAKVYDFAGNCGVSGALKLDVVNGSNVLPTFTIDYPADGDSFYEGQEIFISTTPAPNSYISSMKLFVDQGLEETDSTAPFQFKYSLPTAGSETDYSIKLVAEGADGKTDDEEITVTALVDDVAPQVTIKTPAADQVLVVGQTYQIDAYTIDNVSMDRVAFTAGSFSDSDSESESVDNIFEKFSTTFTPSAAGSLLISAEAFDDKGNSSTYEVNVTVVEDSAPSITVLSPADGSYAYQGGTVDLELFVSDDVQVTDVEVYSDGNLEKTVPVYKQSKTLTVSDVPIHSDGKKITIKAYDGVNNASPGIADLVLSVLLDDEAPSCTLTTPRSGKEFLNSQTVVVEVEAQDNFGIDDVDLYLNNTKQSLTPTELARTFETVMIDDPLTFGKLTTSTIEKSQWRFSFVPSDLGLSDGLATLFVEVTDKGENTQETQTITLNIVPDQVPPFVTVTTPEPGRIFFAPEGDIPGDTISVKINAVDNVGVVLTKVFIMPGGGTEIELTESGGVFEYELTEVTEENTCRIVATAEDAGGNKAESAPVDVIVRPGSENPNPPEPNRPSVTISSPSADALIYNGQTVNVEVDIEDQEKNISSAYLVDSEIEVRKSAADVSGFEFTAQEATADFSVSSFSFGTGTDDGIEFSFVAGSEDGQQVNVCLPAVPVSVDAGTDYVLSVTAPESAVGFEVAVFAELEDANQNLHTISDQLYTFVDGALSNDFVLTMPGTVDLPATLRIQLFDNSDSSKLPTGIQEFTLLLPDSKTVSDFAVTCNDQSVVVTAFSFDETSGSETINDSFVVEESDCPSERYFTALAFNNDDLKRFGKSDVAAVQFEKDQQGPVTEFAVENGSSVYENVTYTMGFDIEDETELQSAILFKDGVQIHSYPNLSGTSVSLSKEFTPSSEEIGDVIEFYVIAKDARLNTLKSKSLFLNVKADLSPSVEFTEVENVWCGSVVPDAFNSVAGIEVLEGENVTFTATSFDDVGVADLTCHVGTTELTEITNGSFEWTPAIGTAGSEEYVTVEAKDTSGKTTQRVILVRVVNDIPPYATLIEPVVSQGLTAGRRVVRMRALAVDNAGISKIEFLVNHQVYQKITSFNNLEFNDEGIVTPFDQQVENGIGTFPHIYMEFLSNGFHAQTARVDITVPSVNMPVDTVVKLGVRVTDCFGNVYYKCGV